MKKVVGTSGEVPPEASVKASIGSFREFFHYVYFHFHLYRKASTTSMEASIKFHGSALLNLLYRLGACRYGG